MSVRFYKRLFLVALCLCIIIPIIASVCLGVSSTRQRGTNEALQTELSKTQRALNELLNQPSTGQPVVGAGAGSAAAHAEPLDYQTHFTELYSGAKLSSQRTKAEKTVYLTFDDGPSIHTQALLDVLAQADVKATFFVTGQMGETASERMKLIAKAGHTLGLHSYTHNYQEVYRSVDTYLQDFDEIYRMAQTATGQKAEIFRFPGGSINSYNTGLYQELIAEMGRRGFVFFDWNVSGGDTVPGATAAEITENVVSGVRGKNRAIVLLHDAAGKKATVDALPGIIQALREQGYMLEPLTTDVLPIVFSYSSEM